MLPCVALADPLSGESWTGPYVGGNLDFQRGVPDSKGLISLHAGYDHQMGDMVLGGELEYANADAGAPGGSIDWMLRAKLRVGYATGRTLIYGTAGGVRSDGTTGGEFGLLAGAGVEYRLFEHLTVGGELLTHHFPDFDDRGRHDVQSLSARVSFRF